MAHIRSRWEAAPLGLSAAVQEAGAGRVAEPFCATDAVVFCPDT